MWLILVVVVDGETVSDSCSDRGEKLVVIVVVIRVRGW